MKKRLISLIISSLFFVIVQAQPYGLTLYNADNGFPSEIIKTVAKDSLGFLWIGIDEGVFRFDGHRIAFYKNRLADDFVKNLLLTQTGHLYMVHDMGLSEIKYTTQNATIEPVIEGQNKAFVYSDSTINYPKQLFEDRQGNIWISEFLSISRYDGHKLKRYHFDKENEAFNFQYSFSLCQDKNNTLWALSFPGNLFYFDNAADQFVQVPLPLPLQQTTSLLTPDDSTLWIGARRGVYELKLGSNNTIKSIELIVEKQGVTSLAKTGEILYTGTFGNGLFRTVLSSMKTEAVEPLYGQTINQLYLHTASELWICTNRGVALLRNTFFESIPIQRDQFISGVTHYVQSVSENSEGRLFVSLSGAVAEVIETANSFRLRLVLNWEKSGFIAQIAAVNNGIWIGDQSGHLFFYSVETRKITEITDAKAGLFTNHLVCDTAGNLWGVQKKYRGIIRVSPTFEVKHYEATEGVNNQPYTVRIDNNGNLYTAGNSDSAFLYKYNRATDRFENISQPLPFATESEFAVHDIAFTPDRAIWLATTDGLLKLHNHQIQRIDLGNDASRQVVYAVATSPDSTIWLANTLRLINYSNNRLLYFSKQSGLPANTAVSRNIFFDRHNHLWVATVKGLAVASNPAMPPYSTPKPILYQLLLNDTDIQKEQTEKYTNSLQFSLRARYICPDYPNNNTLYQSRLLEIDTAWSKPDKRREFTWVGLPAGTYTLQIRALQQNQKTQWSKPLTIQFTTPQTWYLSWWAGVLGIVTFFFIIWLVAKLYAIRLKRDNIRLERTVQERTAEIEAQKEEIEQQAEYLRSANDEILQKNKYLEDMNSEKNSLMGIVAHDLRAPLNNVSSLTQLIEMKGTLSDSQQHYCHLLYKVVDDGLNLIQDILDINAIEEHRTKIHRSRVNIAAFLHEHTENYKEQAQKKHIRLHFENEAGEVICRIDENFLRRIMDNLISNAIKFSPEGKNIWVKLQEATGEWLITVKDEGPGFTPEDQSQLYKKFKKLSARPTAGESSTGLGLSIVKTLVEDLDGDIKLISSPGNGSKFVIHFPKNTSNQQTEQKFENKPKK